MASTNLLHLLSNYPLATPPDVATHAASTGTPTAGVVTTHLLDPALPPVAATQLVTTITSAASGRPVYIYGRWLTRPLSAQTIGAGNWQLYTVIRFTGTFYALALGFAVAQWRPDTGIIARACSVPIYPADVQTLQTTGGPTAGTFTVIWTSLTSGTIAFNATAAAVQTALSAIVVGGVTCTGGPLGTAPVTVTFNTVGPEPLLGLGTNSLTGGSAPSVAFAHVAPAAGAAGALLVDSSTTGADYVAVSTLAGSALTLLAGDCLLLEVWSSGLLNNGVAASIALSLLSNGAAEYVPGKYAGNTFSDTDAYLLAPVPVVFP